MAGAGLELFDFSVEVTADDPVVPDDFNPFTLWTRTFQDEFEVEHRESDGSHVSPLIPVAAGVLNSAGIPQSLEGLSNGQKIAGGRYRYTLDPPLLSAEQYFALAWPVGDAGSPAYFAVESEKDAGFTKSDTEFEIEICDQNDNDQDREHVVLVFGPRVGESFGDG